MVVAGGSGGYNPRVADIIAKELDEESTLKLINIIFEYYKEVAELGEKLSFMIGRLGVGNFKNEVLKRAKLL